MTRSFIEKRPDVARRFAMAWRRAVEAIAADPTTRAYLKGNTLTPPDLVDIVPLPGFTMVDAMNEQEKRDLQAFVDFATDARILDGKVETARFTAVLDK